MNTTSYHAIRKKPSRIKQAMRLILPAVIFLTCPLDLTAQEDYSQQTLNELYQAAKQNRRSPDWNRTIIERGLAIIAENPDVPQTATNAELLWRRILFPAAERLYLLEKNEVNRKQLENFAAKVANNPIRKGHEIYREKIHAEEVLLDMKLILAPQNATVEIRKLLEKYRDEKEVDYVSSSVIAAGRLALKYKCTELLTEILMDIEKRYMAIPGAIDLLVDSGRAPVFTGEMKNLDGDVLKFPEDFKGKIVVLDFWATWCAPCVRSLPHIGALHEKYKDKGVVVIGVSCDTPINKENLEENRKKVTRFIKGKKLDWLQTYEGKWPATAEKYGVRRIPNVMILDRKGRIVRFQARGNEEAIIEQLLGKRE